MGKAITNYKKIYERIGNRTPIKIDCGALCNKTCCTGDADTGMYLYPGEQLLYRGGIKFGKVKKSNFSYSFEGQKKRVYVFTCDGTCDRERRPLACRVFPFVPYIDEAGNAEIIVDTRAEAMCPLAAHADEVDFDEEFISCLAEAFALGLEDDEFAAFVKAQSALIDEYEALSV